MNKFLMKAFDVAFPFMAVAGVLLMIGGALAGGYYLGTWIVK